MSGTRLDEWTRWNVPWRGGGPATLLPLRGTRGEPHLPRGMSGEVQHDLGILSGARRMAEGRRNKYRPWRSAQDCPLIRCSLKR